MARRRTRSVLSRDADTMASVSPVRSWSSSPSTFRGVALAEGAGAAAEGAGGAAGVGSTFSASTAGARGAAGAGSSLSAAGAAVASAGSLCAFCSGRRATWTRGAGQAQPSLVIQPVNSTLRRCDAFEYRLKSLH